MDNLTTSCQSCNLGKGATPLDNTLKETRTRRRPSGPTGFAIPGYARRAALKGQAMGLLRRWSPEEARRRGREGGKASVAKAGGVDAFQERMRRGKSGEATP